MLDSKPCDTHCLPYNRLAKDDGVPYNNLIAYKSITGALHYLTFTRLDVAFSVHQVLSIYAESNDCSFHSS